MAGKLFKFLKKIKLNRKSENLLKKSHPIKTDKFDNTIGLESWKVLTDELHEHDIIASNLNMDCHMTKPRYSHSTADLTTQSEKKSQRQAPKIAQLTRHQSDVLDSATSSLKTIDVDEILYSDFKDGSNKEPSSGSVRHTEEFESTDESQSMSSESNSSEITTFTIQPTQTLEDSKQIGHVNHSIESEETNEEHSSDSFTHVTESIYANLPEENTKNHSDDMSAISVTELCESIRLISAFGSLPDLPVNYAHRPTLLSNNVNTTPGRNTTKQVCQYCKQVCKNRAGLISHQRMSKLCKVKQQEMNLLHVQVQTVVN